MRSTDPVARLYITSLDVLIDEDHVAVWIAESQTGGIGTRLFGFRTQCRPARFEAFLNLTNVLELLQWLGFAVPTRIECQDVFLKHALEEADGRGSVAQNKPIMSGLTHDGLESEFFVEGVGGLDVFDG